MALLGADGRSGKMRVYLLSPVQGSGTVLVAVDDMDGMDAARSFDQARTVLSSLRFAPRS